MGMYNLIKVLIYCFSLIYVYGPWTAQQTSRNSSYQNIATSTFTLCCGVAVTNIFSAPPTRSHTTLQKSSFANLQIEATLEYAIINLTPTVK